MRKAYYASEGSGDRCFPKVRSPNFNFSAPFDLEFAATLLIHPLLWGGACLDIAKIRNTHIYDDMDESFRFSNAR